MTDRSTLACGVEARRKKLVGNPDWNGLDFLEVSDDQLSLCVHFFGPVPDRVDLSNVRIEGGRRVRDVRPVKVEIDRAEDPELDDCLRITVDKPGDFSTYRVCLVELVPPDDDAATADQPLRYRPLAGLDPRYACLDFSFKVDCASDLDCKSTPACPPEARAVPDIDYLAKDYASFRQLILDRLAVTMPGWQETHVPDIGVTLVELLAYVADHLSYMQDAVATEAYFDTARLRVSVRRHALLVDYHMHEGCNARAWVTVETDSDTPSLKARDLYFITGFAELAATGRSIAESRLVDVTGGQYEVFEPVVDDPEAELQFFAAHSEIRLYTWGDNECCLPAGATRATLLDEGRRLRLRQGDVLVFEEILGPTTGNPADADPARRHAVRLTRVEPNEDGLLGKTVLDVAWSREDALPFSLCLSARLPSPNCRWLQDVSVARGNVVLVDHGRSVTEPLGQVETAETVGECVCDGAVIETTARAARFAPSLLATPLTFREPPHADASATATMLQDPRGALPQVSLSEEPAPGEQGPGASWEARQDLLDSGGDDRHFVVEVDDDGRATLRFGDGDLGRLPAAGTRFTASYRIGTGSAGNVGRDTITYMVLRTGTLSGAGIRPRNPLSARGGTEAEPVAEVKLVAPYAVRQHLARAITADDYAQLAQGSPKLQRAAAQLSWTGSWYEARIAVDPGGTEDPDSALLAEIEQSLHPYRRMGHDLSVVPARYVPLDIALNVCALPHYTRGEVKAALLDVFSSKRLPDGRSGFFHPDNLSFGDGVFLSQIVAAARAVEGVETVEVVRLQRLQIPAGEQADLGAIASGVLPLGPMEIAQLDNDPDFPEHGKIVLTMGGGR